MDDKKNELDADHGRVEDCICRVYCELCFVQESWNWKGLRSLVEVGTKDEGRSRRMGLL